MKKILSFLIIFICFTFSVKAVSKDNVTFSKCVDGDTAKFILNKKEITVRFLAVDTPETKHPTKGEQPFGKEASKYTCDRLKKAKKIVLEYDSNSDKVDKYDRYLAWVFVDNSLIQEELIKLGYAKTAYLYGDYKYTNKLQKKEEKAKNDKVGIWSDYKEKFDLKKFIMNLDFKIKILICIVVIIIIIVYLSNDKKARKRALYKGKNKIKKIIKNIK